MTPYKTPPGMRFAFDTDGTRVFRTTAAHGWAEIPNWMLPSMLRTDDGVYWLPDTTQTNMLTLFFPEPRDILAVFMSCTFNNTGSYPYTWTVGGDKDINTTVFDYPIRCETSVDTSDGINGTWAQTSFRGGNPRATRIDSAKDYGYTMNSSATRHRIAGEASVGWSSYGGRPTVTYRTGAAGLYSDVGSGPAPLAGNSLGVRALRFWLETYNSSNGKYEFQSSLFLQMLHVYGRMSAGASTGQLVAWHSTENRPLTMSDTDQGNVMLGSTRKTTFRVKNLSPSKMAVQPTVFVDIPMVRVDPSSTPNVLLSVDDTEYVESCTLDDLGPGAISPILTVRRVTPMTAALGVSSFRVGMSVKDWTV